MLKDYWYATIGAIIGSLISIWWTKRELRREQRQDKQKYIVRLRDCLLFNVDRLKQAKDQLQQEIVPNYPLDTAQLNDWIVQSSELLDKKLIQEIDWQRYQLDHITAKISAVSLFVVLRSGGMMGGQAGEYYKALMSSLREHIDGALKSLPPLIEKIPHA